MSKRQRKINNNVNKLPMAFLKLPVQTQVVFQRLRQLVDRFAFINCHTGVITYTRKDSPKVKRSFNEVQSAALFADLYDTYTPYVRRTASSAPFATPYGEA